MGASCKACGTSIENKLFGRKTRHNEEGKGPNGKVFDDEVGKENKANKGGQVENYQDPKLTNPGGANYNPSFYSVQPKMQETPASPTTHGDALTIAGKVEYNPTGVTTPVEDESARLARIEAERVKQREQMEEIRKRLDREEQLAKLKEQVKVPVTNEHTNNKPAVVPNDSAQVSPVQTQAAAKPAQDFGEPPKKISGLNREFQYAVFPEDSGAATDETKYSSHQIAIEDSEWNQLHKSMNGEFYDQDFPAEAKSLIGAKTATTEADRKKLADFQSYSFKRLSYQLKDISVIKDNVSPQDIFQGGLGDCYFLSALASAAEYPDRILRSILQKTRSEKGAYCIAFCITGVWIPVVIDDIFPLRPDEVLPFCYTKNKEIWAMLYEKAYAKVYGAYWHIGCGGTSSNALKDITGAPTVYINLKNEEEEKTCLESIFHGDKKDFIMNASSKGKGEEKSPLGIIAGHAYTLVGAYTTSTGVKLLKLRNPWGKGEWKGAWADDSDQWTPQLKQELGWADADDGIFFMTYPDFKENFEAVTICHYHNDFIYSYVQMSSPGGALEMVQVSVAKEGEYYFGMSQPDAHMFMHDPKYELGYLSCFLVKKDGDNFAYVDGFSSTTRDPWVKCHLKPGAYLAIYFVSWNSSNTNLSFWTYGVSNTVLRKVVDEPNLTQGLDIISKCLLQKALSSDSGWTKFKQPQLQNARYKFEHCSNGYGYYAFDNQVEGLTLTATLNKTSTNCGYITPVSGGDQCELTLTNGDQKIVVYQVSNLPNKIGFKCGFKMSMES